MLSVSNIYLIKLDKAYEAGRAAAASENNNESSNPYSYRAESDLYWEWMRGFRDYKYGN